SVTSQHDLEAAMRSSGRYRDPVLYAFAAGTAVQLHLVAHGVPGAQYLQGVSRQREGAQQLGDPSVLDKVPSQRLGFKAAAHRVLHSAYHAVGEDAVLDVG